MVFWGTGRKVLSGLILFLVILTVLFPCQAQTKEPDGGWEGSNYDDFSNYARETKLDESAATWTVTEGRQQALKKKAQEQQQQQPVKDEGGLFEKAVAEIFNAIFRIIYGDGKRPGLLGRWGFKDLDHLVFDKPQNWDSLLHPAPFSEQQWQKLDHLYYGMVGVAWALYLVLTLVASGRFMSGGFNKSPEARAEGKATLWRMLFALVIMIGAPVLVRAFFVLANAVQVGIADAAKSSSGLLDRGFVESVATGSVLGTAIVKCAFAWITFQVNIIFWVRDVVMSVMYAFTPLMAVLWAANRNVTAAAVWLGELLTNAFLPAAYTLAEVRARGDGKEPGAPVLCGTERCPLARARGADGSHA
ncbi:hypothetical protein [Desulfothermobacter acidiphilus]|uniref:hypothetical protein n=1 Tax=Desulfothermobacter acidiphilus TaxID=1938353 RepID=UPI003F8C656C